MPAFSARSNGRLDTCHEDLRRLFRAVVRGFDCTIVEGHRGEERQNMMVERGLSRVRWPDGKHNTTPARAVDVIPWPVDWNDRERMTLLAGYVQGMAAGMGIGIRWGGDWDGDTEVADNRFDDLVHFELTD